MTYDEMLELMKPWSRKSAEIGAEMQKIREEYMWSNIPFKPGDHVRLVSYNRTGKILGGTIISRDLIRLNVDLDKQYPTDNSCCVPTCAKNLILIKNEVTIA